MIFFSFVFSIDPITNELSVDRQGTSVLVCSTLQTITENVFSGETSGTSALDFLNEKFGC